MLDDGMQATGGGLAVKDVATLLAEATERGRLQAVVDALDLPAGEASRIGS